MIKKLWLGLFFLLIFLVLPIKVLAASEEFSTSYDVTYDVSPDGITDVTQKITLKNLTSKYYASNFTLSIGSTTLTDVSASDDSGSMEVKVENQGNKTSIDVKFNSQVVGIDKQQTFTLKFKSKDFAQALGKTWEINLPKIPEAENITVYNLVLSVPLNFGDPTSISPNPRSQTENFDRLFFTFVKDQLTKNGVSVNFGTFQIFDYNLQYHLENTSLFPVITSITLPPDTSYQDITLSRINPLPQNVTIDDDGNYLAWYRLSSRSQQDIEVVGSGKLYINPKIKQPLSLSEDKKVAWTKSDKYWEKSNPVITATLREIFKEGTPQTNREKARLIYQYVVETLKYNINRLNGNDIERLGAVTVLNNPNSAVCMEFTDLFVTLARAANVPARELDGFAYSQNKSLRPLSLVGKDPKALTVTKDLLHAWPEYLDQEKGWVMVDPTWENSSGGVDYFNKFDLNHLVLAIKGISSTTPYTSDDVKVTISEGGFLAKPQLQVDVEIPSSIWVGFPVVATIKVTNQGNALATQSAMTIQTRQLKILGEDSVTLGPIPAFGSATYKANLRAPLLWQLTDDSFEVNTNGQKIIKKVEIKPLFLFLPIPYLLIGCGVLIALIYLMILGLHIYKKRRLSLVKAAKK